MQHIKNLLGDAPKEFIIKLLFPLRNRFVLLEAKRAKNKIVNINYSNIPNLGDQISPIIVNYMLSKKAISPDTPISKTRHLCAIGSVLTAGIQDCTVWGSGVLNAKLTYRLKRRKLDVRAVRGPITRAVLMDYGYKIPQVYGDPAIFMPDIYTPLNIKKTNRFGLIFHFAEVDDKSSYLSKNTEGLYANIKHIDISTSDYKTFVDNILSVDIVISQSLHGIILAEAYGIPSILLQPKSSYLKYSDWYFSTGRLEFPVANSVSEAVKITPPAIPDLTQLKKDLTASFPYDIYSI